MSLAGPRDAAAAAARGRRGRGGLGWYGIPGLGRLGRPVGAPALSPGPDANLGLGGWNGSWMDPWVGRAWTSRGREGVIAGVGRGWTPGG